MAVEGAREYEDDRRDDGSKAELGRGHGVERRSGGAM